MWAGAPNLRSPTSAGAPCLAFETWGSCFPGVTHDAFGSVHLRRGSRLHSADDSTTCIDDRSATGTESGRCDTDLPKTIAKCPTDAITPGSSSLQAGAAAAAAADAPSSPGAKNTIGGTAQSRAETIMGQKTDMNKKDASAAVQGILKSGQQQWQNQSNKSAICSQNQGSCHCSQYPNFVRGLL